MGSRKPGGGSSAHSQNTASSIERLKDMGVEPSLLSAAINCIIAQRLARRLCLDCRQPYTPSQEELERCPFCEGREAETPPEVFSYGPPGRQPDTPGWSLRVVPNLYPALERQEVVIHTPRHARSLVELSSTELSNVAGAWTSRAEAAHAEPGATADPGRP